MSDCFVNRSCSLGKIRKVIEFQNSCDKYIKKARQNSKEIIQIISRFFYVQIINFISVNKLKMYLHAKVYIIKHCTVI